MFICTSVLAKHTGGTKFYRAATFFDSTSSMAVVIFQWGANGTHGTLQTEWCTAHTIAKKQANRKLLDKQKRGYVEEPEVVLETELASDVEKWLTGVFGVAHTARLMSEITNKLNVKGYSFNDGSKHPILKAYVVDTSADVPTIDRSSDPNWGTW